MARRMNGEVAALVQRCEAVGWHCRRTKRGHVVITTDRRDTFTLRLNDFGGYSGLRDARAAVRRHGLEAAEQRKRDRHSTSRRRAPAQRDGAAP